MSNKRIEYIKKNNPKLSDKIIQKLSSVDPTGEKKYLVWLVKMYNNLKLSEEQFDSANLLLTSFNENKNKIPQDKRDLNSFSSLLGLATFLMSFERENKKSEELFLKAGSRRVYEDENWLVASPLTLEASIKLGKGTTWCTAAKNHAHNHFHNYARNGELFIVIDKNLKDRSTLKKRQLNFRYNSISSECRNAKNNSIDVVKFFKENKEIFKAISEYPSLSYQIDNNAAFFVLLENPTEEQKTKAISRDVNSIRYIKDISAEIQKVYMAHLHSIRKDGTYHTSDTTHFNKMFKFIENPSQDSQLIAVNVNPNLVKYIQEKKGEISEKVQIDAVKVKPSIVKAIINPCKKAIVHALQTIPELIKDIEKPTAKQQVDAVSKKPNLIKEIEKPCKVAIIEAIKGKDSLYSDFKDKLVEKDIIEILEHKPVVIKYISEPSEDVQYAAVKSSYKMVKHIDNPCKKVKALVTRRKNQEKKIREEIKRKEEENSREMRSLSDLWKQKQRDRDEYGRNEYGRRSWDNDYTYDSYKYYKQEKEYKEEKRRLSMEEEAYHLILKYIKGKL